ncbi:endoplasmic reticulum export factor CTAGE5-like [Papaver somniferum]|uniref:endoplasmic reticulum export factor CTAGE5-like n=1 Tax=Papaver somniferum TaxID=3469 RepID=UPI000E6F5B0A|nr:endoplasmic reticulum export factor CTAGE5-like [Papaver somniferum]
MEIYRLSDEAASLFRSAHHLVDDDTLLNYLNSSLNNLTEDKVNSFSFEKLKSEYQLLSIDHRSSLTSCNSYKRRFRESKDRIKVLETKNNSLIDEKDNAILKGAKELEKFQKLLLEVQVERDLALRDKEALMKERNIIRSQLLIESKDEFKWDAMVLNDARTDLAVKVSLESKHTALVKDIIFNNEEKDYLRQIREFQKQLDESKKLSEELQKQLEEFKRISEELGTKYDALDSKYRKLKNNYVATVSNNNKDAIRGNNAAVKIVCEENNIPLSNYHIEDVSPNEDIPEISDSEVEYMEYEDEEVEEEIHNYDTERSNHDGSGVNRNNENNLNED